MLKEALLYEPLGDNKVHCFLCNHHCKIAESRSGFCRVRQNRDGKLYTRAYGRVIAANIDPIEKKPLYHVMPGSYVFSVATMGCNFHCSFCQNWQISQVTESSDPELPGTPLSPEEIVQRAEQEGCTGIAYTYTEPTIFFAYAYDTAKPAHEKGLLNLFVTNGYMTSEALETIHPYLSACNVDLKSFRDAFYRKTCKGRLQPVLDGIRLMKKLGIWVEVTTLVIPEENDSEEELREIAQFLVDVDPSIPWHISRFYPDYELRDSQPTPVETLKKAMEIGKEEGLAFVYPGNVPQESADTACPSCGKIVVRRGALVLEENRIKDGKCPFCGEAVPGIFA